MTDERTVVTRPPTVAQDHHGQFVSSSSLLGHTLPEGTRFGALEIVGLIGEGGFGIVYLAHDATLERRVAVKEYMPSSLAARAKGEPYVVVKSERHVELFNAGLKSFVNEARLLARFDHPSLVKVYSFWEANGTAYMAMPYYEGPTLKRALAQMGHPPDEATLRGWLNPLLNALTVMHGEHCFHRDIAPDNILLTTNGPLLLDFGAARRVIGDMTHGLTAVLKPGYAPIEQYGEMSTLSQGAWTDLYALACVVYHAVTGRTPMSSVDRMVADSLVPLSQVARGRYSPALLGAVDAALAVLPHDRPQDVARFRALLDAGLLERRAPSQAAPRAAARVPDVIAALDAAQPKATSARAASDTTQRTTAPGAALAGRSRVRRLVTVYALGAAACVAAITAVALLISAPPAPSPAHALPADAGTNAPLPANAAANTATNAAAPVITGVTTAPPTASIALPATTSLPAASTSTVSTAPADGPPRNDDLVPGAVPAAVSVAVPIDARPAAEPPAVQPWPAASPLVEPAEAKRAARTTPHAAAPAAPAPPAASAAKLGGKPSRCSDILQKASLETLTSEEAAYLRGECR